MYRKHCIKHSIEIGKYIVSPLIKQTDDGLYAPSVSIRTGRGSATHDRVLRLTPRFDSLHAAVRYATDEGLRWIGMPAAPLSSQH